MENTDIIRGRRIELTDDRGNLQLVLDGEEGNEGHPGLAVYGPDGPTSGVGINVDRESGQPRMMFSPGGGSILLTFVNGFAVVETKDEDGTHRRLVP